MPKKKATSKSKAVATKTTNTALAAGIDISHDLGAGMEGVDKDSFAIPFLAIVQKMSPQVDEADAKYLPEAKPGMLLETVGNALFSGKDGVIFLPCAFQRRFLQWGPREKGGGFKGEYMPEEATALEMDGKVVNSNGRLYFPKEDGSVSEKECDFLADTRNHFGILLDDSGNAISVLLSMSSTQIKKSKQLMTLLDNVKVDTKNGQVTPPTWVNRVRLTTVPESNEKGSWHGLRVELDGFIDSQEIYDRGKSLHDVIAKGKVNVDYKVAESQEASDKF